MRSFTDLNGKIHFFENKFELSLDIAKDVETGRVTAYLVDNLPVSEETYRAIEALPQ